MYAVVGRRSSVVCPSSALGTWYLLLRVHQFCIKDGEAELSGIISETKLRWAYSPIWAAKCQCGNSLWNTQRAGGRIGLKSGNGIAENELAAVIDLQRLG